MAHALERAPRDPAEPVMFLGPEHMANKIRLVTAGRIPVAVVDELPSNRAAWPAALILIQEQAARVDLRGYRTRTVTSDVRRIRLRGLVRAFRERRILDYLESQRDEYVVATRP